MAVQHRVDQRAEPDQPAAHALRLDLERLDAIVGACRSGAIVGSTGEWSVIA